MKSEVSKNGYQINQTIKEKNYNMISAAIHLAGDLLNALAELAAALAAEFFGVNADIADASCALFSATCIIFLSLYILIDIHFAAERLNKTKYDIIEDSLFHLLAVDLD